MNTNPLERLTQRPNRVRRAIAIAACTLAAGAFSGTAAAAPPVEVCPPGGVSVDVRLDTQPLVHRRVVARHSRYAGHRWVDGYWTTRLERVLVERAYDHREFVPPVVQIRYDACGLAYEHVVRDGYHRTVRVPARFEQRRVRRWVEGHWVRIAQARAYQRSHRQRGHSSQRRGSGRW